MEFLDRNGRPIHLMNRVMITSSDLPVSCRVTEMHSPLTADEASDHEPWPAIIVARPFSSTMTVAAEGRQHEDGYCIFEDVEITT